MAARRLMSPDLAATAGTECRDDRGRRYTQGAIVPVANEPGTFARCVLDSPAGSAPMVRWAEYALAR